MYACENRGLCVCDLHVGFDDVGVYLSHTIDSMGAHDAQMGHVNSPASFLLDQRHTADTVHILRKQRCYVLHNRGTRVCVCGCLYLCICVYMGLRLICGSMTDVSLDDTVD